MKNISGLRPFSVSIPCVFFYRDCKYTGLTIFTGSARVALIAIPCSPTPHTDPRTHVQILRPPLIRYSRNESNHESKEESTTRTGLRNCLLDLHSNPIIGRLEVPRDSTDLSSLFTTPRPNHLQFSFLFSASKNRTEPS